MQCYSDDDDREVRFMMCSCNYVKQQAVWDCDVYVDAIHNERDSWIGIMALNTHP